MDTAAAVTAESPDAPPVADVPPIGVASIPAAADVAAPPAPVPSVPVLSGSTPIAVPTPTPAVEPAPAPAVAVAVEPAPDPAVAVGPIPGAGPASGFSPWVSSRLGSYVYLLVDPRTGRPFYVGRGRNDRCFRHVRAARHPGAPGGSGTDRFPALDRIREIESSDRAVRIDILRHGLTPDEARLVEAAAHEALGLPGEPPLGPQRRSAAEVGELLAKRAKIKRRHQLVLLRVGGTGADASDRQVRRGWRIGHRWTDPESPRSPRWAAIVAGDLVVAVYRIERWEPVASGPAEGGEATARPPDRFSFVGSPDPDLEGRYVGKRVTAYLAAGSRNPVTYVWCGPHWVNTPV